MASGDFTVSVNVKGNDEIAVMGQSIQKFIQAMRQMIAQIEDVSVRVLSFCGNTCKLCNIFCYLIN